jgi:hypothetical protein
MTATIIFLDHAFAAGATFPTTFPRKAVQLVIRNIDFSKFCRVTTGEMRFAMAVLTGVPSTANTLPNFLPPVLLGDKCTAILAPAVQLGTWVGQLFHLG